MKMSCLPEGVNWNNKEFTKEMLDYMRAVYCMHPMVLDALDYIDSIESRIAELEAENAGLKERVAMLDVNSVYKSLGEMGYIEQVARLNARIAELEQYLSNKETEYTDLWDDALAFQARIAELKELLDTESQLSNQFYLLLVDNPKSKKLADDLIEALRINGKEVQE